MNPLSMFKNLPLLGEEPEVDEEAKAKADRIKFHRESVRNGPVKMRHVTSGQQRRAQKRHVMSQVKKQRRENVQNHKVARTAAAALRGHLQAAGVLPYASGYRCSPEAAAESIRWISRNFSDERLPGQDVIVERIQTCFQHYQTLTGQVATPLSPAYRLPDGVSWDDIAWHDAGYVEEVMA